MTFPLGQAISILRRTASGEDGYGNDTFTTSSTTVSGAFAPGGSTELSQAGSLVVTQPTAYLPAGSVVGAGDALDIDGTRYEVDGDPSVWVSPFTAWQPGIVVRLRRVTG